METAEAFCGQDVLALSLGERVATQSPGEGLRTTEGAKPPHPNPLPMGEGADGALPSASTTRQGR